MNRSIRDVARATFEGGIDLSHGSWIHREDVWSAVWARLEQRLKRRVKGRKRIAENIKDIVNIVNELLEDLYIASLVNNRPWNERQAAGVTQMLRDLSSNRNSIEGLLRAFERGKSPTWKKIDITILSNWREIHIHPPELQAMIEAGEESKLPGLWDWSPKAVENFFAWSNVESGRKDGLFDDWFRKRCMRLGLKGNVPYRIKEFRVDGDIIKIVR
jgi:hypothetical protein